MTEMLLLVKMTPSTNWPWCDCIIQSVPPVDRLQKCDRNSWNINDDEGVVEAISHFEGHHQHSIFLRGSEPIYEWHLAKDVIMYCFELCLDRTDNERKKKIYTHGYNLIIDDVAELPDSHSTPFSKENHKELPLQLENASEKEVQELAPIKQLSIKFCQDNLPKCMRFRITFGLTTLTGSIASQPAGVNVLFKTHHIIFKKWCRILNN